MMKLLIVIGNSVSIYVDSWVLVDIVDSLCFVCLRLCMKVDIWLSIMFVCLL